LEGGNVTTKGEIGKRWVSVGEKKGGEKLGGTSSMREGENTPRNYTGEAHLWILREVKGLRERYGGKECYGNQTGLEKKRE